LISVKTSLCRSSRISLRCCAMTEDEPTGGRTADGSTRAPRRSKNAEADDRSTRTEKFSDDCPRAGTSDT
jgi:hypothetical protein